MIDVKTAFLLWVIQAGTLAILLFAIWLHARDQRHFLWFGLGFLLQAVGLGMVGLRDQIPAVISIHVGNTLSLLGFVCWGQALCAFDGRRVPAYVALPAAIWVGGNAVPMLTAELGYRMAIYNTAAAAGLVALAAITLTGTFSTRRYRRMLGTVWFLQAGACLVFAYMATRIMPRSFTEMTLAVAVSIVGLIAFVTAMTLIAKMMMDRSEERLQALVRADPLTGALNRRGFSDAFEQLVGTAPSSAIAMIIFDLDHFKQVNDRHGHQVGDRVLLEFSATCKAHLPQRAAFGRTGGEEFAAVLAVNEPKDAALFAETVRMAFAEREIDAETQRIHATTSVGIAVAPLATANLETMMAQADAALYAAKAEGRNRTSVKTGAHVVTVPPAHSDSLDAQADRQVAVLKRIAAVGNKLHD
ncbi:GGDEF domain-containing protein [Rhizobium sp. AQ_MP]|uniref:diguanylate cyclase n=1 Tax=Rhizobium sp. AQ_MP TaxID=2761536 RepID=UPI001639D097|nr:GGDEF domain-containing protein [Rhizobium sp. AQ_MP]